MKTLSALGLVSLVASIAAAQEVKGVVRDSASGAAVPGAVVSLLDASGRVVSRTIADGDGRYRFARVTSAAKLQVLRIGFRPRSLALTGAAGTDSMIIAIASLPTLLESVAVRDASLCPARNDHNQALSLWEQARAALLGSVVARQANPAAVQLLQYHRVLDRSGRRVVSQQVRADSGTSTRPFVAARTPADFAARGYVVDRFTSDSYNRFYGAPDADVLLDDSFAGTHCFQIEQANSEHTGQLGLAFVPAPGRDSLADVTGILWVQTSPPVLASMEFRYTGLEPAVTDVGAGGAIAFHTMPNGIAFIDRWSLKTPALAIAHGMDPSGPRRSRRDVKVSAMEEVGGVVVNALWSDGAHWSATMGSLRGHVMTTDSAPVAGARVWMDDLPRGGISGPGGAFVFDRLLGGQVIVHVVDSSLAALGIVSARDQAVEVRDSSATDLAIVLPSREEVVARVCGGGVARSRGLIVLSLGMLRIQARTAYVVQWSDSSGRAFRAARTDSLGRAAVCNVPLDVPIGVRASPPAGAQRDTILRVPLKERMALLRL